MWIFWLIGVAQLGSLIYQFSTGHPLGQRRFFGREVEPDSELFWALYAFQVFGFVLYVGFIVCKFYFKVF
jgi:hypothetical protein